MQYKLKELILDLRKHIKSMFEEAEDEHVLKKLSNAYDLTIEAKTILECAEARAAGKPLSKLLADRIALTLDAVSRKEIQATGGTAKEMLTTVVRIMDEIEKEQTEKAMERARKAMKIPSLDEVTKGITRIY
jgi:hypothetical protein